MFHSLQTEELGIFNHIVMDSESHGYGFRVKMDTGK